MPALREELSRNGRSVRPCARSDVVQPQRPVSSGVGRSAVPTFRRTTIAHADGVRHVSSTDGPSRAFCAGLKPGVLPPVRCELHGIGQGVPAWLATAFIPSSRQSPRRQLIGGILEDEVGRQPGRDRVAITAVRRVSTRCRTSNVPSRERRGWQPRPPRARSARWKRLVRRRAQHDQFGAPARGHHQVASASRNAAAHQASTRIGAHRRLPRQDQTYASNTARGALMSSGRPARPLGRAATAPIRTRASASRRLPPS